MARNDDERSGRLPTSTTSQYIAKVEESTKVEIKYDICCQRILTEDLKMYKNVTKYS